RHADVDDGEIGLVALDGDEQRIAVTHRCHHLLAGVDEQVREPGAQEDGVFGDHDPHGNSTMTVVGPPGGLRTCIRPPRALTRSARPWRPLPRAGSAPPTPSSVISTTRRSRCRAMATDAFVAWACLATLARASVTTKYAVLSTGAGGRSATSTDRVT